MTARCVPWGRARGGLRRAAGAALGALAAVLALAGGPAAASAAAGRGVASSGSVPAATVRQVPVLAYYYIWFDPTSWNRAKTDYPLVGRYSSSDAAVIREQIRLAKQAGITGFLVSWKDTPLLDRRLALLRSVAAAARFRLSIVFEGRDFHGSPLPMTEVRASFRYLSTHYARDPVFHILGAPLVVWSGTWAYTQRQLASVTRGYGSRLTILASARYPSGYQAIAGLFRGDAYYWSSADPLRTPGYAEKLREFGAVVRQRHGLWIAPAAPGFDKRLLGGRSVTPRRGGQTLRLEMTAALASSPAAIGLISWNEYSENSEVEPSQANGNTALRVLAAAEHATPPPAASATPTSTSGFHAGPSQFVLLGGLVALLGGGLAAMARRRSPRSSTPDSGLPSLDGRPPWA